MRHRILSHRLSISDFAAFCFLTGIILGTVWANLEGQAEEAGIFLHSFLKTGYSEAGEFSVLISKRCFLVGFLWLLGMSLLAVPGIFFFFFCCGGSMAFLLSVLTMQSGVGGLLLFLASIVPQIFFYLPIFAVLSVWAMNRSQKLHLTGFLVLLVLTAAGAGAEVWMGSAVRTAVFSWLSQIM